MKHLIFMFAFVATVALASCHKSQKSAEEVEAPNDSIEVVGTIAIDTIAGDTVAVDSIL